MHSHQLWYRLMGNMGLFLLCIGLSVSLGQTALVRAAVPVPAEPPDVQTQLLRNTGFEDGVAPWQEQSSGRYELINSTNIHTGKHSAYLCGYPHCQDSIFQAVALPPNSQRVVLSYWAFVGHIDPSTTCQDTLHVFLRTAQGKPIATVQKLCNTDANGWQPYSFDVTSVLAAYRGQTIQVAFTAKGASGPRAIFFVCVDDISLLSQSHSVGVSTQVLGNTGFEDGLLPWQEQSSGGYPLINRANPHLGKYSAYLCGYNNCQDSIFQTALLPASTHKVVLSYWVFIARSDPSTTCQDTFVISLRTLQGAPIAAVQKLCNTDANGWQPYSFDVTSVLAAYRGHAVQIVFTARGSSGPRANFSLNLDDVVLIVTH